MFANSAGRPKQISALSLEPSSSSASVAVAPTKWSENGATCLTCGIGISTPGFSTPAEQRAHFKTDWHRYNVKRKLAKQPPISEEQFEAMIEQEDEVSCMGCGIVAPCR